MKMRVFRAFFLCAVSFVCACLMLFVFGCSSVPVGTKICVLSDGNLTFSGAVEQSLEKGESVVYAKAGERLTLETDEAFFGHFLINGVRVSKEKISFTVPGKEVHLKMVLACEEPYDTLLDPMQTDVKPFEASEIFASAFRPFFPSVTQAEDGTILVVYYLSDGHALYNQSEGKLSGVLQLVRSKDLGNSWSEPETIVDLTDENWILDDYNREARDPNLQRLSDGTILLTFPVRAPIGKAGLNTSSGKLNDYWCERSYYMTSLDNGKTWSEMKLIECDYFSEGQPFLYDDPERTTGCWVKNGSAAELENGDLLFPLYGAKTCDSRGDYTGVCVKAKNNGDGTLTFYKDWATIDGKTTDASLILPKGKGNEVALVGSGEVVYALSRTAIPSATKGGVLYRSDDGGKTFEAVALEPTENDCLNQPNFCVLGGDLVLANYSVPLASVYDSPARRTARPVYGKLFNVKTGVWEEYDAVTVYDTSTATVADMGNPASVLLQDGRILTVYYDTSAPSARAGFIGATFTTLSDYVGGDEKKLQSALNAFLSEK